MRDIVVIGGSAGSIEAVTELVRGLPPDFPGSVFVVVHFPGSLNSTYPRSSAEQALFRPGTPETVSRSSRAEFMWPLPTSTFI
jgi:hypothetical protein